MAYGGDIISKVPGFTFSELKTQIISLIRAVRFLVSESTEMESVWKMHLK